MFSDIKLHILSVKFVNAVKIVTSFLKTSKKLTWHSNKKLINN